MNHTVEMTLVECRICGTPVSIATRIWDNLSANGGAFRCPMGHDIRPRASDEITKLQEELTEVRKRLDISRANVDERDGTIAYLTRANNALRGCLKSARRRAT